MSASTVSVSVLPTLAFLETQLKILCDLRDHMMPMCDALEAAAEELTTQHEADAWSDCTPEQFAALEKKEKKAWRHYEAYAASLGNINYLIQETNQIHSWLK